MKNYTKTIEKAYGTEPEWSTPFASAEDRDHALQKAFNWYWNKGTKRDRKRWVLDYCKHAKMPADAIKCVSQNGIKSYSTIGYLCRMLVRGAPLTPETKKGVTEEIEKLRVSGSVVLSKRSASVSALPTIRERVEKKYREYLGDIDVFVDSAVEACLNKSDLRFDPVRWATNRGIKALHCSKIASYIENTYLQEMAEAYSGKDPQLKEGYAYISKPKFKKLIQVLADTANTIRSFGDERKTQRKPRQKKAKSPNQLTKNIKYLAKSDEFGVSSVSPEKLIGASVVVVFNEKYRTLTVYHAKDPRGLSVKGTTITNYDTVRSVSKKLRKPKESIERITGVRSVTAVLDGITTKSVQPTGRLNEHCVLLGAY